MIEVFDTPCGHITALFAENASVTVRLSGEQQWIEIETPDGERVEVSISSAGVTVFHHIAEQPIEQPDRERGAVLPFPGSGSGALP